MKQNKDYWLRPIGRHKVSDIYMLDKNTCLLRLETEILDDSFSVQTVIVYWLDEKSWHFNNTITERKTEDFVGTYESEYLPDEEKKKCKELIMQFLKEKRIVK